MTPPYFDGMGRGQQARSGSLDGAAVVLWNFMSAEEQKQWAVQAGKRQDWILVRRASKKQKGGEADMPPGKIWKELSRERDGPGESKGRDMRERNWRGTGNVKTCENRYALVCQVPEDWTAGEEKEEAWQRVEMSWFSQSKKTKRTTSGCAGGVEERHTGWVRKPEAWGHMASTGRS